MNIFILTYEIDPPRHYKLNSQFHCDKHVIKMITESVQMLVTAYHDFMPTPAGDLKLPCRPLAAGHAKHPCVLWLRQNITHYNYLAQLAQSLCLEKQSRWPLNADHDYHYFLDVLTSHIHSIHGLSHRSPLPQTFATAVKSETLRSTNTPHDAAVTIYRSYYIQDKAGFATWRGIGSPYWWPSVPPQQNISRRRGLTTH
jgi:hypothetical protein